MICTLKWYIQGILHICKFCIFGGNHRNSTRKIIITLTWICSAVVQFGCCQHRHFLWFSLRGDFKVMFPGSEAEFTAGVFFLLENACRELATVSHNLQRRVSDGQLHGKNTSGSRSIYSGFVYSRMLWGKCLTNKFFVEYSKCICLTCTLHAHPMIVLV